MPVTHLAMPYEIVDVIDSDKDPRPRKNVDYRFVFGLFYSNGKWPKSWEFKREHVEAARFLYETIECDELSDAMQFYMKHKDEKYCPQINSPSDLLEKWGKLEAHLKRS